MSMADAAHEANGAQAQRARAARIELLWSPFPVVVLFAAVSIVWIVGTDWALEWLVGDQELAAALQTAKGLLWIVLAGALLYVLLSRARRNQRLLHEEIARHQEELETRVRERTAKLLDSREQLRLLTRRLDQLGETERKRISRELHDQMGSDLTGLKLDLQALGQQLPAGDRVNAERVTAAIALVDSMYRTLRDLSSQLRPAVLDEFGLAAGIEWLVAEFRKRSNCECTTDIEELAASPDELRDTMLFRTCQEALTNVLKHAQASRVHVALGATDGTIRLLVEDNGRGTAESVARSHDKLGIVGMRERAISVGGTAVMEPRPGGGTRVRVEVPWSRDGARRTRT